MRTKILSILITLTILLAASTAYSMTFDFDDGTRQGWTFQRLVYNSSTGTSTLMYSGNTGWLDTMNYPNSFGSDPIGNNHGSATVAFDGSKVAEEVKIHGGNWVIINFISPNLSSMSDWQNINSFSVQIMPSLASVLSINPYYANLYYIVDDHGTGTERTFFNGTATDLTELSWNMKMFPGIQSTLSGASPPVVSYTTKRVIAKIWIDPKDLPPEFVIISLDEVTPSSSSSGTCVGHCGGEGVGGCWCDDQCATYGDCCPDYEAVCGGSTQTCVGHCGGEGVGDCWCDDQCASYGDCCPDYEAVCGGSTQTCVGHCGGEGVGDCWCDDQCATFGDCCPDYEAVCGGSTQTCVGHCGGEGVGDCWCDDQCATFGDCCPDYEAVCGGSTQTCVGHCGGEGVGDCWCDDQCATFGDCCPDYEEVCL